MPRDFREMRMRDATAIWTKSISASAKPLPLAGYAVSRHFCFLAEQVRQAGRHDADDLAAVTSFLKQQSGVQAKLEQKAALCHGWGEGFHRHRELAYRTVQFFDRVSLWLCCADEQEQHSHCPHRWAKSSPFLHDRRRRSPKNLLRPFTDCKPRGPTSGSGA